MLLLKAIARMCGERANDAKAKIKLLSVVVLPGDVGLRECAAGALLLGVKYLYSTLATRA
jgi:hypothetical protein